MKGFLYIYNKSLKQDYNAKTIINRINELKNVKHTFFEKSNPKMSCFYYTNEKQLNKKQIDSKHVSLVGQYVEDEESIINVLSNSSENKAKNYVSELRGAFAIAIADFQKNDLIFYTHIYRIDNIFYRETDQQVVIGTDPLIVSALSNFKDFTPEVEIENTVSFLMNGYFADEKTLFKDIKLVPPNSAMKVDEGGISILMIDNTLNEILSVKPNKNINDELKNDYIESFKAIPSGTKMKLGITGGKDSRLALLGLLEAGYSVDTNTRGFMDNPDVQIAAEITNKLKLEHSITEPKVNDEKGLNIDIEKKVLNAMKATSGQVYGYENIPYATTYKGNKGVTGVAALSLKGGYSNLNQVKPLNAKNEIIKRFSPFQDLLKEGVYDDYHEFLRSLVTHDFQEAQYKHALFYRNGRWTSGTRLAKSYTSDIYSPFYDNLFSKNVIKIQKKYLDSGFVQFTLTNKLNKDIARMPLAGSRWGFENSEPTKPENFHGWLKRAPLYANKKLANFNWRNVSLEDNHLIREKFKDILLSDPDHIIYQIVDIQKVIDLFNGKITNKYVKFLWALLSLHTYINYLQGKRTTPNFINLTIPKSMINELNKTPQLIDLTPEIISINDNLILTSLGRELNVMSSDKKDKNRYLATFTNNLTEGTSHKKAIIENRVKLMFNMYIDSKIKFEVKYCIIFFKDQEKLETIWFKNIIGNSSKNLKGNVKIPKSANNFKLSFKMPQDKKINADIKYLYYLVE
ncbi:hypothetical protein [Salinicoccus sp. HZC-1]|uniref:hypothetical protein n=1 Tax=Salinicoccus sp. HZC-1 TaxID=3385497 RepID=UPI00398AEEBC